MKGRAQDLEFLGDFNQGKTAMDSMKNTKRTKNKMEKRKNIRYTSSLSLPRLQKHSYVVRVASFLLRQ